MKIAKVAWGSATGGPNVALHAACIAALLLSATLAMAQSTEPQYPDAPDAHALATTKARKSPRPKSQAEYDAYKAAAMLTDPAKLEAAATDFSEKFPESELRSALFQQTMGLYQRVHDAGKTLEMARDALKYDADNAVALLAAAQVLAERAHDSDLDRDDRLAEARADAQGALQKAGDIAPPTNLTAEQFDAALTELRGAAHEVLGTIAFRKQDYSTAIQEYYLAAAEEKERTDAVLWLRLAVVYDRKGEYSTAATTVQKAIAASEPGSQIRQVAEQEKARLEKLLSDAVKPAGK